MLLTSLLSLGKPKELQGEIGESLCVWEEAKEKLLLHKEGGAQTQHL